MDDKLYQVILKLLDKTTSSKVNWEDASRLSEGEKFRVSLGEAIVEVWDGEISYPTDDGDFIHEKKYDARVLNAYGLIVAQQEFTLKMGLPYWNVEKLFLAARSSARRSDVVLDNLLQKLGA